MQPNPNCSLLERENLRNLLGGQLLHIVEHENNAQGWGDAQNSLVEQVVLLGGEEILSGPTAASASNLANSSLFGINSSSESRLAGA